jgi:hypothetical protein
LQYERHRQGEERGTKGFRQGQGSGWARMEDEGRVDQTKAGAKQRGEKVKDVFRK